MVLAYRFCVTSDFGEEDTFIFYSIWAADMLTCEHDDHSSSLFGKYWYYITVVRGILALLALLEALCVWPLGLA